MSALSGIIFTPDVTLHEELERALCQIKSFQLIRHDGRHYPQQREVTRLLNIHSPSVLFVDVAEMPSALEVAKEAREHMPGIQLVAIARRFESEVMLVAMQAGIREFLALPIHVEEIREALSRLQRVLDKRSPAAERVNVFCFLPSKPGVGASTVCLNTAAALAAQPDSRVLLLDFDFCSGSLDFMLNLQSGYSVRDAAEYAGQIDDVIWQRFISKSGPLDVLRAGTPDPNRIPPAAHLAALIRYARQHYTAVCIDLPGAADPGSVEALRACHQVLLVTSPEVASVHLAARTISLLKEQNLDDRLGVVVNRVNSRGNISRSQIEEILGTEVIMTFPNSYDVLQRALFEGSAVVEGGVLGKRFAEFASALTHPRREGDPRPGLLGYFNRVFRDKPASSEL